MLRTYSKLLFLFTGKTEKISLAGGVIQLE